MRVPMNRRGAVLGVVAVVIGTAISVSVDPSLASDSTRTRIKNTASFKTPLSPLETARAEVWGLSEMEWRRYRRLMEGIRGSVSPSTISPIEVLGIHSRDSGERRRYAEAWARMMREDIDRILAFQHAYDEAGRRLYPGELLIDPSRLPTDEPENADLMPEDRVLLFTRPACPRCDVLLDQLLRRVDAVAGIDIYLSELAPGDEGAVREWAVSKGIRPQWVKSRRVTLNFDVGALERLTRGQTRAPILMLRRGDDITPLAASAL